VLEIDGASNNGVDDVRRLMESLPYRPVRDRYKVVILDECHMVTKEGWNALLKTLEEPHPHVKFVFATTEAHKLLPTILSRVQRYDFRLLPTKGIRDRVAHVLRAEGMAFDDAAVSLVAREAAGSVRDALSLLDQVIAGVDKELTGAAAARLLGVADRKVLYDLARAMLSGDGGGRCGASTPSRGKATTCPTWPKGSWASCVTSWWPASSRTPTTCSTSPTTSARRRMALATAARGRRPGAALHRVGQA
jgi:DNA polymerase III subunit gamma/tau